jgi:hypothetical protein
MSKNPLLYLLSCIYRHFYFLDSTKDIAYDYSLFILTAFLSINIATVLTLLNIITPGQFNIDPFYIYLSILCFFFFLRFVVIPEKKLKEMKIFSRDRGTDNFYIISYGVLSTVAFVYVLIPYIHR